MSDIVIEVENVSKYYRLGFVGTTTLEDDFRRAWAKLRGKPDPTLKIGQEKNNNGDDHIWALRDISFEVKQGEALGIIGRNGSGKSTLLKILSRVTAPTTGECRVKGRIASLLEVGTGFHPELTGRENIFLNGAILGMTKEEIRQKFDEIVAFAEVGKFIDTPVKRYSSGMYVRLAFGVAAHLEPEILIVDEVLAVGDEQFQKKCLGKMHDVGKEGRTVLFVSHNMGAISTLCNKCILLHEGNMNKKGETFEVVNSYLEQNTSPIEKIERAHDFQGNHFQLISMVDGNVFDRMYYRFDEDIFIKIGLILPEFSDSLELAMRLMDRHKRAIFTIHEKLIKYFDNNQNINILLKIPKRFLTPGKYSWVMCINHPGVRLYDLQEDILPFTINETGSDFTRYQNSDYGCVFANYSIRKI